MSRRLLSYALAALALAAMVAMAGIAEAGRPVIMKACTICHTESPNVVRGKLVSYSDKFKSINVNVGPVVWIIKYDDNTAMKGVASIADIPKDKEIAVTWSGPENAALATQISMKQPYKVPEEQVIGLEELRALIQQGPEAGAFTLIDSRPPEGYLSGHIPHAISLPYPKQKQMGEASLPKDKDRMVIFYCAGES